MHLSAQHSRLDKIELSGILSCHLKKEKMKLAIWNKMDKTAGVYAK